MHRPYSVDSSGRSATPRCRYAKQRWREQPQVAARRSESAEAESAAHRNDTTLVVLGVIDGLLLLLAWVLFSMASACNRSPIDWAVGVFWVGSAIAVVGMVKGRRRSAGAIAGFAMLLFFFGTLMILGLAGLSGYEGQCPQ